VAGRFKAFGEQGFTLLFRERAGKRYIGGKEKMTSYRNNSNIDIEEKEAAKEKNKRLFPDILSLIIIPAKRIFLPFSC
jgi:hypothetical protein